MITDTFSIDLGLANTETTEVTTDENGHYHVKIRSTETKGICRIFDHKITTFHEFDREITIQHLPILGRECYLHIRLPRFKCKSCPKSPTTTLQVPWRHRKSAYTVDFEKYLLNSGSNPLIVVDDISIN